MFTIWKALTANSFIFLFSIVASVIAFAITTYIYLKRKICSVIGLFIRALLISITIFILSLLALNILHLLWIGLANYGIVIIIIIVVILLFSV